MSKEEAKAALDLACKGLKTAMERRETARPRIEPKGKTLYIVRRNDELEVLRRLGNCAY